MAGPMYAMVSTEMRRDLDDPIRYFRSIEVKHLYNCTPWKDMVSADFSDRTIRYADSRDLARKLQALQPDIVQGVEPFALKPLPRLKAILDYVRLNAKPLVLVSLENIPLLRKYGPLALAASPLIRRCIRQAGLIFYINEGARRNFLRYGADPARMVKLMYGCWGVDIGEFCPDGDVADVPVGSHRVVLFVGRLHAIKGVFDLLEAYKRIAASTDDVDLVFIGSGPAEAKLRRASSSAGLSRRVHFAGAVKNRDLARYMRRAELLVAPSVTTHLWAEQVGMVLLQAMACGVPVVSTTSGSIPEFVIDGQTGLLVPERQPAALGRAIRQLLEDGPLRSRLAAQARRHVVTSYDAQRNVALAEQTILRSCALP